MTDEHALCQAILQRPGDRELRLIYADWLEEHGDPRHEILRLLDQLTRALEVPHRSRLELRLRKLVEQRIAPPGPFFVNSIGMRLAAIPPGIFRMGSADKERGHDWDETQHTVTLTYPFFLGVFPVTQREWQAVMGSNPASFPGDDRPVERVSWHDCADFCTKLSRQEGRVYRLPTEAEWEYACRAGTTSPYFTGADLKALRKVGWCSFDKHAGSGRETHPVGSLLPNAFGLYDMHGNVWEWCADWYAAFTEGPLEDPVGPDIGTYRALRGGAWYSIPNGCRAAYRNRQTADSRQAYMGFRVCLEVSAAGPPKITASRRSRRSTSSPEPERPTV
jgi:uncharacterized protein (TIGR02996 family)